MLYEIKYWTLKNQHKYKVSVAKKIMLRWRCGKTRHDKIKNNNIRQSVGVTPIVKKRNEKQTSWFRHLERRLVDYYVVSRVNQIDRSQIARGRGKPRKTIRKIIKKHLEINNLDKNMIINKTLLWKLIHVADPMKLEYYYES